MISPLDMIYLKPALGDVPMAKMTKSHMMKCPDEQARKFSPATVNGT